MLHYCVNEGGKIKRKNVLSNLQKCSGNIINVNTNNTNDITKHLHNYTNTEYKHIHTYFLQLWSKVSDSDGSLAIFLCSVSFIHHLWFLFLSGPLIMFYVFHLCKVFFKSHS